MMESGGVSLDGAPAGRRGQSDARPMGRARRTRRSGRTTHLTKLAAPETPQTGCSDHSRTAADRSEYQNHKVIHKIRCENSFVVFWASRFGRTANRARGKR